MTHPTRDWMTEHFLFGGKYMSYLGRSIPEVWEGYDGLDEDEYGLILQARSGRAIGGTANVDNCDWICGNIAAFNFYNALPSEFVKQRWRDRTSDWRESSAYQTWKEKQEARDRKVSEYLAYRERTAELVRAANAKHYAAVQRQTAAEVREAIEEAKREQEEVPAVLAYWYTAEQLQIGYVALMGLVK